ncbi:MAG: glycosyltransferase family 39 protein [Candidatus Krumholzibacteriia bacterium]
MLAVATGYLGLFVVLAFLRVPYPYELEWMEGGAVDHVRRLLEGHRLYGPPTLEFVPFIYTPLYFWVSALAAAVLGVDFLALRLVSAAAAVAAFLLLSELARRETGSRAAGLIAAGIFAATYRASGAWFDVARVDILMVALLLAALLSYRRAESWRGDVAAGMWLCLAVLAKQSALVLGASLLLHGLVTRPGWRRLALPAGTVLPLLVSTALMQGGSDGWYVYYVLDLPRQHALAPEFAGWWFWRGDLLAEVPVLLALAAALPAAVLRATVLRATALPAAVRLRYRRDALLAALLLAGAVAAAWLGRLHSGGWDNVLMPLHAVLSLLAAVTYQAARRRFTACTDPRAAAAAALLPLLILVQLAWLAYPPAAQLPTTADRAAGDAMIARLRGLPGDVFIPYHGHYAALAGKPSWAHAAAVSDVLRGDDPRRTEDLLELLRDALAEGRFTALVLDEPLPELAQVEHPYRDAGPVFERPGVFWPVTGRPTRPEHLLLHAGRLAAE